MKIGTHTAHRTTPKAGTDADKGGSLHSPDFADRLSREKVADDAMPRSPNDPVAPDFRSMTKQDYVAWGCKAFERGDITLDDLFQVQFAGGDLDGSVALDDRPYDFISFFNALIDNENRAQRATAAQSMLPVYRNVLLAMKRAAAK